MEKKKINSPFVRPDDREEFPGVPAGETKYIDRQILLEFVQTGTDENGKAIGSVRPVVHETYQDINELIQSHADEVGVINMIKLYARTGNEQLFNQNAALPAGDYSVVPEESAAEIYAKLPEELTNGLSMEEFFKQFGPEIWNSFIQAMQNKTEEKKVEEVNENE